MNALVIAQNTFREIIRDRILYGLVVFAVLMIGLSLALGGLSFTENGRIALDFGLVGMQLSVVMLAIFAGSTLVSKEIEKQTILTILSRPLSRTSFLVGKLIGMMSVVFVILIGLTAILALVLPFLEITMGPSFFKSIYGLFLEAFVLLCMTLFLGTMIRPFLTVACSVAFFLIGHWVSTLEFFAGRTDSKTFQLLSKLLMRSIPNLEVFNWREHALYQDGVSPQVLGHATLFALGWGLIFMSLGVAVFRRRDFV